MTIQTLEEKRAERVQSHTLQFGLFIIGALIIFLLVLVKAKTAPDAFLHPVIYAYALFVTVFQLTRIGASTMHESSLERFYGKEASRLYEPYVSIVIPCKNEEKAIQLTIRKCYEADYPKNKFEVIVINDGSTDGTNRALKKIKKQFPKLTIVNWRKNRGKRHGMAEGFRRAKGEIVVQLDSDSYIDPKTFRNLIIPFHDPFVGAVCAHADPENAKENVLTKMQAAYYFMSFRIFKAAESAFLTVFCCSGCSSAFRKEAVMPILNNWLNEKFLGKPVIWGDDRALTSWVLRGGYRTIYTHKVQAFTIVPNNLRQLLKQQLRWKKSWIINAIFTGRFLYRREPFIAFFYFFPLILISVLTPFIAFNVFVIGAIFNDSVPWYYFAGIFLMTAAIAVYYRLLSKQNGYWPYLFGWTILNMFVLSYLIIVAALRLQDRRWGTR